MHKAKFDITHQEQIKIIDSFDFESDTNNFKFDFKTMTKRFGRSFIEYCRIMWYVDETNNIDSFCKMNADIPKGFFENMIKK